VGTTASSALQSKSERFGVWWHVNNTIFCFSSPRPQCSRRQTHTPPKVHLTTYHKTLARQLQRGLLNGSKSTRGQRGHNNGDRRAGEFFLFKANPRISPQLPCRESATAQTNNLIVKSSSQMMNCTATVERIRQRDDVCAVRRSRWLPCIRNGL
jgi:hypothetical protein